MENDGNRQTLLKQYGMIVALCILFCIISRAPSIFDEISLGGLKLTNVNVGWIVIIGPWVILVGMIWLLYYAEAFVGTSVERSRIAQAVIVLLALLPAIAEIFLLRQLVFETTQPGIPCEQFDHFRLFTDFDLASAAGWKPHYCFGLKPEQQESMPHFYPPYQTWAHVILPFLVGAAGIRIRRFL
ncbi:hypothetical protein VQ03_24380 [Methylobacterium tarhaniae]|uniref:Uncharacterized protein n=1 Tax=Methylobacterium tarhaniae TaxID=1187852 RepID=A0A0J6SJG5_9HYPH|nr:hypothetical protein [Methylobacterium tarhaniae]KMO33787.1 hypothetical protein VQ03_24380 [Methylobacterium tarhaniae]